MVITYKRNLVEIKLSRLKKPKKAKKPSNLKYFFYIIPFSIIFIPSWVGWLALIITILIILWQLIDQKRKG